jgi:hypothetical protein
MTTNAQISKAIETATGYHSVKVSKGGGLCRFYFDSPDEQGIILGITDSIYIHRLNMLTPEKWVDEFEHVLSESGQPNKRNKTT